MTIPDEQARTVGELLYPDREWHESEPWYVHDEHHMFTFEPEDPRECWAMACYLAKRYDDDVLNIIRALEFEDPAALVALMLAVGGEG